MLDVSRQYARFQIRNMGVVWNDQLVLHILLGAALIRPHWRSVILKNLLQDLTMDWSLLQDKGVKNKFLRKDLAYASYIPVSQLFFRPINVLIDFCSQTYYFAIVSLTTLSGRKR